MDFHSAREHARIVANIDDGDEVDAIAGGCVCVHPLNVMNISIPDGWLSTRQSVRTLSSSMRQERPASVSPPRSVSAQSEIEAPTSLISPLLTAAI